MSTAGFSPLKMNIFELASSVADPPNPAIVLDADAVVPAQLCSHRCHSVKGQGDRGTAVFQQARYHG